MLEANFEKKPFNDKISEINFLKKLMVYNIIVI